MSNKISITNTNVQGLLGKNTACFNKGLNKLQMLIVLILSL